MKTSGTGKSCASTSFVHNLVLGRLLGLLLALGEEGLANGLAKLVQVAVVAQFLGELVVQFGQVPCAGCP